MYLKIIFWDMTPCSPLSCNGLHGVISQKMILFITTAVKTSNPTEIYLIFCSINILLSLMSLLKCLRLKTEVLLSFFVLRLYLARYFIRCGFMFPFILSSCNLLRCLVGTYLFIAFIGVIL
jgi:hypothetical protein